MTPNGLHAWKYPLDALNHVPGWGGDACALVVWARWTADGLYYLKDLDDSHRIPTPLGSHQWEVVDLAHIRWAAASAMTAIDLCAAALSRKVGIGPRLGRNGSTHELDLVDLSNKCPTGAPKMWAQNVANDPDVQLLMAIRNPMVHARLPRNLSVGGGGSQRTHLDLGALGSHEAGAVVELARKTAARVVEDFWDQAVGGTL